MFRRKRSKPAAIGTLIGAATRIEGDVQFSGGLHLEGTINGDVNSTPGDLRASLWVGTHGAIEGSVVVPNIVLNGVVKGDIDAMHRVELGESARVLGNVRYSVIESAVGAQINGKLIHRPNEGDGSVEPAPPQASQF